MAIEARAEFWPQTGSAYPAALVLFTIASAAKVAFIERQVDGGAWLRLMENATWATPGGGGAPDLEFFRDADFDSALLPCAFILLVHGIYEYRIATYDYISGAPSGDPTYTYCVTPYGDNALYADVPVIRAFTASVNATDERGITLSVVADSGDDTSNTLDMVNYVQFWNDGELQSDSPLQLYEAGYSYPWQLTAGSGIKTVYCEVSHGAYAASSTASVSVTYAAPAVTPEPTMENLIICFGAAVGHNFTGDKTGTVSATFEHAEFPATNVQQYDLGVPWKSKGGLYVGSELLPWGSIENAGGLRTFTCWLQWNFMAAKIIDVFAILAHNFPDQAVYAQAFGGDFEVKLFWATGGPPTDDSPNIDLTTFIAKETIVHMPKFSRRYWGIRIRMVDLSAAACDANTFQFPPHSIGRIVFNEHNQCWTPTYNQERQWTKTQHDPSKIETGDDGTRRATEKAIYRSYDFSFDAMTNANHLTMRDIYALQGTKRPVFVLFDPLYVTEGTTTAPKSANPVDPETCYGYFDASMARAMRVNDYADLRLRLTEARKP